MKKREKEKDANAQRRSRLRDRLLSKFANLFVFVAKTIFYLFNDLDSFSRDNCTSGYLYIEDIKVKAVSRFGRPLSLEWRFSD